MSSSPGIPPEVGHWNGEIKHAAAPRHNFKKQKSSAVSPSSSDGSVSTAVFPCTRRKKKVKQKNRYTWHRPMITPVTLNLLEWLWCPPQIGLINLSVYFTVLNSSNAFKLSVNVPESEIVVNFDMSVLVLLGFHHKRRIGTLRSRWLQTVNFLKRIYTYLTYLIVNYKNQSPVRCQEFFVMVEKSPFSVS